MSVPIGDTGTGSQATGDKDGALLDSSGGFFSFSASSFLDGLMRKAGQSTVGTSPTQSMQFSNGASEVQPARQPVGPAGHHLPERPQDGVGVMGFSEQGNDEMSRATLSTATSGSYPVESMDSSSRSIGSTGGQFKPVLPTMNVFGSGNFGTSATTALPTNSAQAGYDGRTSAVGSGQLAAVEQRVTRLEQDVKGLDVMSQEHHPDSQMPEIEEQLQQFGTHLAAHKQSRKSLEDRLSRIKGSLSLEREEREAWLKAFRQALSKSLTDLDVCVDQSIAESSKSMLDRLDAAERMMLRLGKRVDDIPWATRGIEQGEVLPSPAPVAAVATTLLPQGPEAGSAVPSPSLITKEPGTPRRQSGGSLSLEPPNPDTREVDSPSKRNSMVSEMVRDYEEEVQSRASSVRPGLPAWIQQKKDWAAQQREKLGTNPGDSMPSNRGSLTAPSSGTLSESMETFESLRRSSTGSLKVPCGGIGTSGAMTTPGGLGTPKAINTPGGSPKNRPASCASPTPSDVPFPMESAQLLQDWQEVLNENLRLQQVHSGLLSQRRKQRSSSAGSKSVGASPSQTPVGRSPSSRSRGVGDNIVSSSPKPGYRMIGNAAGRAGSVRLPTVAEQPVLQPTGT